MIRLMIGAVLAAYAMYSGAMSASSMITRHFAGNSSTTSTCSGSMSNSTLVAVMMVSTSPPDSSAVTFTLIIRR